MLDSHAGFSLVPAALARAYGTAGVRPTEVAELVHERSQQKAAGVWIHLRTRAELVAEAERLEARQREGQRLRLFGVPFAVKDNIDVAGVPTTAGCPAFSYVPARSAHVVEKLLAAGGLFVGKTNMDQLATGLVGVRSPYGTPTNPFDERYIVGGSSSGSAAAVSRGMVSFALGTDTAGSGRVPAAFTNLVGLKPSRGLISTSGVVPACRSLDCVSVFGLSVSDAVSVAELLRGHDPTDPYSRTESCRLRWCGATAPAEFRFGIPREPEFFGDAAYAAEFESAVERLEKLGGRKTELDFAPFHEAARLLYEGAWVAERLSTFEALLEANPAALLPVIRQILSGAKAHTATDAFRAMHRLQALKQHSRTILHDLALLVVPTAPTIYRIAEVEAEPFTLNARLGTYTNFVNLLDLAAIAVPSGFRADGLPFGISLIGARDSDPLLAAVARNFEQSAARTLGASGAFPDPADATEPVVRRDPDSMQLCVVGAHLSGEPLNHQLTSLGARLIEATKTAPKYRLFALPATAPPKPGLVRAEHGGHAIEVEVWELTLGAFGAFFQNVTTPLGIGQVELESGEYVAGFLCESYATLGARDISELGGWRRFIHRGET